MKKKLQKRMKITCKIDDNVDSDISNPHSTYNKIHETLRLTNYVNFCNVEKCPPTIVPPVHCSSSVLFRRTALCQWIDPWSSMKWCHKIAPNLNQSQWNWYRIPSSLTTSTNQTLLLLPQIPPPDDLEHTPCPLSHGLHCTLIVIIAVMKNK